MWSTLKTNKKDVMLNLQYEDFATLQVEKSINDKNVSMFIVRINILTLVHEELTIYKTNDLSAILTYVKEAIEDLEAEIDDMSDNELNQWISKFLDRINEY